MSFQRLLEQEFNLLDKSRCGFLTKGDIQRLAYAFGLPPTAAQEFLHYCDTDQDGRVSKAEFHDAQLRRKTRRLSQKDVTTVYTRWDSSGQGRLDYERFLRNLKPLNRQWSDAQLKKLFKKYDKSNKGYLTKDEFDTLARDQS
ncbi:hypothetical protein P879_05330 [Paragonimus westermani]|uniref:EF-hand domain-containing protein n=1 Tax=Paragonimus westermani TaxID=34504 RepID=A0A8T0DTM5_9TREM|nr:hypothetical protein P879_05330 [Paragonimus westermani]